MLRWLKNLDFSGVDASDATTDLASGESQARRD